MSREIGVQPDAEGGQGAELPRANGELAVGGAATRGRRAEMSLQAHEIGEQRVEIREQRAEIREQRPGILERVILCIARCPRVGGQRPASPEGLKREPSR